MASKMPRKNRMAASPEKFCTDDWSDDSADQAKTTAAHQICAGKAFHPATVHMEMMSVKSKPLSAVVHHYVFPEDGKMVLFKATPVGCHDLRLVLSLGITHSQRRRWSPRDCTGFQQGQSHHRVRLGVHCLNSTGPVCITECVSKLLEVFFWGVRGAGLGRRTYKNREHVDEKNDWHDMKVQFPNVRCFLLRGRGDQVLIVVELVGLFDLV